MKPQGARLSRPGAEKDTRLGQETGRLLPTGTCETTALSVLPEPLQRLGEDRRPVGVAAPLLHIGQVRLVGLAARRPGRVGLITPGREPAPRAVPRLRHGRIAREAWPGFMIVRTPEGDPHPRRGLASFRLAHGTRPDAASPDGVATTHRPPLALSAALWPSVIQQQIEADDAKKPDDPGENSEPVQIPLHDGR